jgi:hypothetical protein
VQARTIQASPASNTGKRPGRIPRLNRCSKP